MSERVISTQSYEELPLALRRRYPIDGVWDHDKANLVGRPFRFVRAGTGMYAVYDHHGDTIRISVVDARCACLFYRMLNDEGAVRDPDAAKVMALRASDRFVVDDDEPPFTLRLRRASARHFRMAQEVARRVEQGCVHSDDGAEWMTCVTAANTTTTASNPHIGCLRKTLSSR